MLPPVRSTLFRRLLARCSPARFPRIAIPDTATPMTAAVYTRHGDADVIEVVDTYPRPRPAKGQVLVRVRAVGVNPVDFKMRQHPVSGMVFPKPQIPGTDIAGEVIDPNGVSGLSVGQRVFGMMPLLGSTWGGSAQFAPVDASLLAVMPDKMDFVEAAALPLVALTVMQGLDAARPSPGQRVLIQAGSGGVGTFAIQYCRHALGLRVATTCSPRNEELVRSLGAEVVIDYHQQDFTRQIQDYDVVIDPLGYQYERKTLSSGVLRRIGGHYIHIAGSDWSRPQRDPLGLSIPEAAPHRVLRGYRKQLTRNLIARTGLPVAQYHFVFVHPDGARLTRLVPQLEAGKIKAVLDRTFPLSEIADAHRHVESGHTRGKVVIEVP